MYELPELEAAKSLRPDTSVPQVIYISQSFCQDRLGTNISFCQDRLGTNIAVLIQVSRR